MNMLVKEPGKYLHGGCGTVITSEPRPGYLIGELTECGLNKRLCGGCTESDPSVASLIPTYEELERAIRWADDLISEATEKYKLAKVVDTVRVVPVVLSKGQRSRCTAWFSDPKEHAFGWQSRDGEVLQEIAFCAEDLQRSASDLVATVIHEKVHKWCSALELRDCSRKGRHNKIFKRFAEYLGLDVGVAIDSYGFGYTNPSEELTARIEEEFRPDITKMNLHRTVRPGVAKKKKERSWRCSDKCAAIYTRTENKPFGGTCDHCGEEYTREL